MNYKKYIVIIMAVVIALGGTVFFVNFIKRPNIPKSYGELTSLSANELNQVDVALMNLLCAKELPGSENLNVDECLAVLDQWATLVKQSEKKYSAQYFKNPKQYDNSYAKFKAVNLGVPLEQDLKCKYNKNLVQSGAMEDVRSTRFFRDSSDIFIHGFIEKRRGSCSSLPVLMVAIGRRCGYPLYLVTCKGHMFCRWDDGNDKFNIETACRGVDIKPDSYYTSWPHPASNAEIEAEKYLKSLSSKEEFGVFAHLRASCLQENKQFEESKQAYLIALKAFPSSKYLQAYLSNINKIKPQ